MRKFLSAAVFVIACVAALVLAGPAYASCDLNNLIGFTLFAKKTVTAYIDENGQRTDGFIGCQYGRVLVFDDNTGVVCQGYNYSYEYRPDAYLFAHGNSMKACIENEMYDIGPIR
jgi:hypothetical protein